MKIYTVTPHFLSSVRTLFPGSRVELLPQSYQGLEADLLVFTGGEDVHPKRYGRDFSGKGWFDDERDSWEFQVLRDWRRGSLKSSKVLGICRGLQLLNVGFGGSLVYDIPSVYGKSHPSFHDISWRHTNIFSTVLTVNSMHHQCIDEIGHGSPYKVLAEEPSTRVIEAIMWTDRVLAFQFHPEMFGDTPEKKIMVDALHNWLTGTPILSGIDESVKKINKFYAAFNEEINSTITSTLSAAVNWQVLPIEEDSDEDSEEINDEEQDEEDL